MKKVSVFLADGFEEIEGLTVVDILRRAGVEVTTVSVMGRQEIKGAHGIEVKADILIEEMDFCATDMLVLPGGMPGTLNLKNCAVLRELLLAYDKEEKRIAAICAAPSVLGGLGLLKGRKACCYPSFEEQLDTDKVVFDAVAVAGHITTSRGMGTAIPFALELTGQLCGREKAEEIKESIIA